MRMYRSRRGRRTGGQAAAYPADEHCVWKGWGEDAERVR